MNMNVSNSISVQLAKESIQANINNLLSSETCSIYSALNRVLACDIISPINVPAHNNSAMDGYAFRGEILQTSTSTQAVQLKVVGTALAGHPYNNEIKLGECVRIMTGAMMPPNCDTVIPQELVQTQKDDAIQFDTKIIQAHQNCRLQGEDLSKGKIALPKSKVISPADLGLLASLGVMQVEVFRKVKVAFFSTGDELQALGEDLKEGCVFDSNRFTLLGMLQQLHCDVIDLGIVPDNLDSLTTAMQEASKQADVIITSGGVSTGTADFTKEAMVALGDFSFWNLDMRPGRPFAFGKIESEEKPCYVFGLPGNPVAVMVSFYFLIKDALIKIQGAQVQVPILSNAISTAHIKKRVGRTEYQRGIATMSEDGKLEVKVTGSQGSGILKSMSEANCMIVLPPEQQNIHAGEQVHIVLFTGLI